MIVIYTDGACLGNPGPGGYGVVIIDGNGRRELSAGFRKTTNNRMEILAAIAGLEAVAAGSKAKLYTDSQYLSNSMTQGWARRWKANNWKRNKKERALNIDLWERLLKLCDEREVEFVWVRGHANNPENERCDYLAVQAANGANLLPDENYEIMKNEK